ncbi:hypothetical protein ASD19_09865 [Microbacterium sp. Root53]|uniref:transglutaminase family protein n=1 Tax=Microbacterium sp. Root53 TaxID=1736553 RepID=UPI0006FC7398|nr:DUF3488 and transglutaminase-like domain-containing protein [Microbacterium sp. Root53]KQY96235.1 hypothetical protein ASD19_09865 [Microbacterium sp. Root53]
MAVLEAPHRTAPPPSGHGPWTYPLDPTPPVRGLRGDLSMTLGAGVGTIAAMLPIGRLLVPTWLWGAILLIAVVLLTGWLLRRVGVPRVLAAIAELLAWVLGATYALRHDEAVLGVIPTVDLVRDLPRLFADVSVEIVEGVAPMEPSRALSWVLIAAGGLLAFFVGHIVRATRLPLLAAIVLITVFVIPQLAVPGDPDLVAAVILTAAILWLARAELRARRPGMEAGPVASMWAAVLGVGSLVAAVIVAPSAPLGTPIGGGVGRTATISASLDLGDDLRRPADVEVLRLSTDATGGAPYLRVATLTAFNGRTWQPDGAGRNELSFGPVESTAEAVEATTTIEITRLTSEYLPVPYPAVEVRGAVGAWSANPFNRTVRSDSTTSLGQSYVVRTQVPQPTREQAQAAVPATGGGAFWHALDDGMAQESLLLPDGAAELVEPIAREVTAGSGSAYDALVAMQAWFRGGEFRYSLEAPVEEGFDGSGMDAIQGFLDVRSGYCVHFASTFAVMARSLGIPARVVVGFLPGVATDQQMDGQTVYSVLGSQLHAWPEAYLDGIGWVPFEPTATLGTPTLLRSEAAPSAGPSAAPTDPSAPTPTPSVSRDVDRGDIEGGGTQATGFDVRALVRGLGVALGLLVLLAVPAVVRAVRWSVRLAAARRGDAVAAWRELQNVAIDAGIAVDESDSPRAFADLLSTKHGVPASALAPLVAGIERASFARDGAPPAPGLARALSQTRVALLPAGRERLRASLIPRSLLVRPRVQGH